MTTVGRRGHRGLYFSEARGLFQRSKNGRHFPEPRGLCVTVGKRLRTRHILHSLKRSSARHQNMSAASASVCPNAPRAPRRHRSLVLPSLQDAAVYPPTPCRLEFDTPCTPTAPADSAEDAANARIARLVARGITNAPRRPARTPNA